MDFNKLAQEINQINEEKGFNALDRRPLEIIALIHSEISEATEIIIAQNGKRVIMNWTDCKTRKPEGFDVEIIDALVRDLGWLAFNGYQFERIVHPVKLHYGNIWDYYQVISKLHWCLDSATEAYRDGKDYLENLAFFAHVIVQYYEDTNQTALFGRLLREKIDYNKTRPYLHGKRC